MKIGKKFFILLFFMLVGLCFIDNSTVKAATQNVTASTYAELKQYLEQAGTDEYIITLSKNITITDTIEVVGTKTVKGAYTLTNGISVSGTSTTKGNEIFYVSEDSELTLDGGVTLNGNNVVTIASSNVIVDGSLIVNNADFHKGTQGIYVSNTGELTMKAGTIAEDNLNIGIVIYGTATINGGTIKCPKVGIQVNSGSLVMNGGTIEDYETYGIENVNSGSIEINAATIQRTDLEVCSAIYHDGDSCKITGITLGENQRVFLADETGYIDIDSNRPTFEIEPATYTRERVMVKVSDTAVTDTEAEEIRENITVYVPKGDPEWSLKPDNKGNLLLWEYSNVMVTYVWNGTYIESAKIISGWAGEPYTTSPITKEHYNLTSTPSNAQGVFGSEDISVVYNYTRDEATITVEYVDSNDGSIIESEDIVGYYGEEYVSTPKQIDGYKVISSEGSVTKTFGTDTKITWQYIKQNKVTVKYINQVTGESVPGYSDMVTTYSYGDIFDQRKIDTIYGYSYVNTTITGASGSTVEAQDIVVTHYYSPVTQVIVKYLDKNNPDNEITSETVIDGYVGKDYTTEAKEVAGYVYKGAADDHTDNTIGKMTAGTITVEYYYIKQVNITVKYIDLATMRDISGYSPVVTTYDQGATIDTKQLTIPGYTYSYTSPEITIAGANDVTITHFYSASTSVIVRHLDKFDTSIEIGTTETIDGYLGKEYTTKALTSLPANYVYREDNTGNTSGKMSSGTTVVEYYYIKRVPVTIKYVDRTTGAELDGYPVTTTTYDQGEVYDAKYISSIGEYTYLSTEIEGADGNKVGADNITITHYYSTNTQVIVRHVDLNDNNIDVGQAQTINGYVGETYTTSPLSGTKLPTNYVYKGNNSGNTTGQIGTNQIIITYYYVKQVPVTVKYVNKYTGEVIEEVKEIYDQGVALDKKEKSIDGYTYLSTEIVGTDSSVVGADDVTVTHYYSKAATVLVKYLDKNNHSKEISEATIINGAAGEPYTAQPLERAPARYVYRGDNSGNITGVFTDEQTVVEFYYTRQAQVTVEYVDKNTGEVINRVEDACDENSTLDRKQEEIEGYTYLNTTVTGTTNDIVGTEDITVTHYYAKNASIVVKYVDKNNSSIEIGDSVTITGYEGKSYVTNKLELIPTNYVYREENSGNTSGVMAAGETNVYYYYIKRIPVTIKYVDKATGDVLDQRIDVYDETSTLDQKQKDILDYTYLNTVVEGTTGNAVGPDDITVTHYYGRNTTVLVKHLDKNNTKIEVGESETIEGYEGKDYTTNILSTIPENYVYEEDNSGNITGKMTRKQLVVEYYYVKQVPVTVKYVDINTNEVIEEVTNIYDETSTLDKKQKDIANYTYLNTIVEGTTGDVVGPDDVTVTHYYAKNTSVLVKYVDQNNHEIEVGASITIDGYVGKEYTTENLVDVPSNYVYKDQNSQNTEGTMTNEQIVVEYYFVKQVPVTIKYMDKNTGDILDEVTEIYDETSALERKEKEIDGFAYSDTVVEGTDTEFVGPNDITITHNYIKESNLIVKYVDENNNEEITDELVTVYKEGDEYTVYAKDFEGYVLADESSQKTGIIGREDVTLTFYYKKISAGIVIKYIDGTTRELLDQEIHQGNVGDVVIATAKDFDDYVLVVEPEQTRVEMKAEYEELVFTYYRRVVLTVRGINTYDQSVLWEYTINGIEGEYYATGYKVLQGYELVNNIDSINGVFDRNNTLVVYEYKKSILKGDMNLDGFVNSTDAALVLDRFKNGDATAEDYERGDMNEDKMLNSTDAAMILDIFKSSGK